MAVCLLARCRGGLVCRWFRVRCGLGLWRRLGLEGVLVVGVAFWGVCFAGLCWIGGEVWREGWGEWETRWSCYRTRSAYRIGPAESMAVN